MKTIIVSMLICFLFAFAAAEQESTPATSNIELDVFSGSNAWWFAVAVNNAGVDTQSVQIQQAQSSSWEDLTYQKGWGYFTISSPTPFAFPISVRCQSVNGDEVTITDAISSLTVGVVSTDVSYSSGSAPTEAEARSQGSKSKSKATAKPTSSPTTKPKKATTAPTTAHKAATTAPKLATTAPKAATTAPKSSGCSTSVGLMVPLYVYPGSAWNTVAAGAASVPTIAIINVDSGPGSGPDSSYKSYMATLANAGVEMVGYVHTSYGTRDIATVKSDIDMWASEFSGIVGIFLDEAGATASVLPYYQELYTYIMSMPGWKYDIINPGTVTTSGYASAATQIVSYEDTSSSFASSANPSFASCSNKNQFAMMTYAASSSTMESNIAAARSKGYYGWVFSTNGAAGGSTYNSLPSFYSSMVSYIASTN